MVRRDIQGLRAIAVIAVIVNHVIAWPSGGFVSVDVFFVISGFLITGLLLRDHERSGRISLGRFYARRVRRIVLTALTVIVVTAAVGYFLFNTARSLSTTWDGIFSVLFVSNWHFTAVGTDYFHATDPASPLQHFWSLSVEEQFYVVWPLLMIVVLALAATLVKTPARRRIVLALVMALLVAASFGYALWQTQSAPTAAYFSTFSRAWELGAGALLAIGALLFARLPTGIRFVLGWGGLIALLASFVLVSDATPFPGRRCPCRGRHDARHRRRNRRPPALPLRARQPAERLRGHPVVLALPLALPGAHLRHAADARADAHHPGHHLRPHRGHLSDLVLHDRAAVSPLPAVRAAGLRREAAEAWQAWRDKTGAQVILSTVALMVVGVVVGLGSFSVLRDHS